MWWSFIRLLQRALSLSFEYMGTNAFAVGFGLLVFLIMQGYVLYREGWGAVKQRFGGSAGFGLSATLFVWICLFGFCVMKAVHSETKKKGETKCKVQSHTSPRVSDP